jgi:hypothetical protein
VLPSAIEEVKRMEATERAFATGGIEMSFLFGLVP